MMEKETKVSGKYKMGRCTVLISMDAGLWHLSISTPYAQPSYKEIKEARYKFIPDSITMAQLFPPTVEFVNLHPYCHHLWEIKGNNEGPKEEIKEEKCVHPLAHVMITKDTYTCFACGENLIVK